MKLEDSLLKRANGRCELCHRAEKLIFYEIPPPSGREESNCIMLCGTCLSQVEKKAELDSDHWKILGETMWSEVPGIQVMAWRMLNRLRSESWAMDNLDMLYLDEPTLSWAKSTGDHEQDAKVDLHKDAYGQLLQSGDTVILTKSLDVKGTSLNAKLGTVVRNIRLVENNTEQIEGKIEGQLIVILSKYVRKQNSQG